MTALKMIRQFSAPVCLFSENNGKSALGVYIYTEIYGNVAEMFWQNATKKRIQHINISKLTVIYIQIISQAKGEFCRSFLQFLTF